MTTIAIAAAIALGAGSGDPALLRYDDALAEALARNADLRAARARLDQARTIGWKAWAAHLPQVTAAASWTRNDRGVELPALAPLLPQPIVLQPLVGRSAQLQAALPLLAPQLWLDIGAAQAGQRQAEWSAEQARREVLFGVAGLYHGAVAARLAAQVAGRQLEIATSHEADAEIRHQAGAAPEAARLRARIDRTRAEQVLEAARAGYEAARLALAAALDRSDARFEVELPDEPAGPARDAAQAALSGRADLRAAEAGQEVARRARAGLWASYLPSLAAFARSEWQDPAGPSGERRSWSAGLALSWTLFDGTLREARLRESAARVEETEAQLRAAELRAREQLERAWLDLRVARANRARALAQVELARENQRLVEVSFREGAATYLEASDAAQQLGTAELAAVSEQLQVRLAMLRLLQAMGARQPA
ncbi:MAG: TolC family protein [Deltaproteobacteria bacterium]|nr:TolC family protein [Deltaproteobacteria bacterium]